MSDGEKLARSGTKLHEGKPHFRFIHGRWYKLEPSEIDEEPLLSVYWCIEGALVGILQRGARGWPPMDLANYSWLWQNGGMSWRIH